MIGRREFEEFKRQRAEFEREALRDRDALHGEVRDAAEEIRSLRRDLRLIAKLGGVLLTVLSSIAPIVLVVIEVTRGR